MRWLMAPLLAGSALLVACRSTPLVVRAPVTSVETPLGTVATEDPRIAPWLAGGGLLLLIGGTMLLSRLGVLKRGRD